MYPAVSSFASDPGRTHARWAVYMNIQPPFLSMTVPKPLPVDSAALAAKVSTGAAAEAINWLIRRGYLVVHSVDGRGVRSVTLAWAIGDAPLRESHG